MKVFYSVFTILGLITLLCCFIMVINMIVPEEPEEIRVRINISLPENLTPEVIEEFLQKFNETATHNYDSGTFETIDPPIDNVWDSNIK